MMSPEFRKRIEAEKARTAYQYDLSFESFEIWLARRELQAEKAERALHDGYREER